MSQTDSTERYSMASIVLHWLMLLLIVGVYAAMEFREFFPKGSAPRDAMKMWHFRLGLSVLALVWLRIAARLKWAAPRPLTKQPAWQAAVARIAHFGLYAFMIGMPFVGWMILSAEGKAAPFFGFELPPLASQDGSLAERMEEVHKLGGAAGYWLIGLHAAASLLHHYVLRDRGLTRMLPTRT